MQYEKRLLNVRDANRKEVYSSAYCIIRLIQGCRLRIEMTVDKAFKACVRIHSLLKKRSRAFK
jgi:hypothetical protein